MGGCRALLSLVCQIAPLQTRWRLRAAAQCYGLLLPTHSVNEGRFRGVAEMTFVCGVRVELVETGGFDRLTLHS